MASNDTPTKNGTNAAGTNNHGVNNAISFVTSALGLLAQESLEIIEDADEVEEDELDHINLVGEQHSPVAIPPTLHEDDFSPLQVQQSAEPPSPTHAPFKHH